MILHFQHLQLVLQLLDLDLCLFQLCSGLLILLPQAPPVLQSAFTALYVLEGPTPRLLVTNIVCDCNLSVVLAVGDACLCYSNSLGLGSFSSFGHTASSCLFLEVFMTIIHLNPSSELYLIADFVNFTNFSQTPSSGQIVFYRHLLDYWVVSSVSLPGQKCSCALCLVQPNPIIHYTLMHSQLFRCRIHTDLATCVCFDYLYLFFCFDFPSL